MKKQLLLIIMPLLLPLVAKADAVEIDGIYYNLNHEEGVAEVTGKSNKYSTDIVIPPSVTYNNIMYDVTGIGDLAFMGCKDLTSVDISDNVVTIGDQAFYGCSGLTSVTIPNSVVSIGQGAFSNCTSLTSVFIPQNVTRIGNAAFYQCTSLASVTISNSVTNIGEWAFRKCTCLTSITIPASVTSIGEWAFDSCESLTSIQVNSGNAKYDSREHCNAIIETCTNTLLLGCMKTVIPNSIVNIGERAFNMCSGLTSITIPNSVLNIGQRAFANCYNLNSITIPEGINNVSNFTFYGCKGLKSIIISSSVTSIGQEAFNGCKSITDVYCYAAQVPSANADAIGYGGSVFDPFVRYATLHVPSSAIENYKADPYWRDFGSIVPLEGEVEDDTYINGIYYSFSENDAEIVRVKNSYSGAMVIPEFITYLGKTYKVTSIGKEAFAGCRDLTSVTIPNSVTNIKDKAFLSCSGLTSLTIPNSVTTIGADAFMDCISLTSVNIPNSVTYIGDGAFSDCISLTSVNIPNSVTNIGVGAFEGCTGLTSVIIPKSVTNISDALFFGCTGLTSVILPQSVSSIGSRAFCNCSNLASITIPDGVTSIGYEVFRLCVKLTSITIPNSVTTIGSSAFADCSGLASVIIGDGLTNIEEGVFQDCKNLTSITIPEKVSGIGERTFSGCSSLTEINLPSGIKRIDRYAFSRCENLTSITFPNALQYIGYGAFENCTSLERLTIPNSVWAIGDYAFSHSGLTTIRIPESVSSINNRLFYGCSGLTSVTIPNSVTSIKDTPFYGCKNLTDVYCYAMVVPTTTNNSFNSSDIESIKLYVPASALEKYRSTSPWNLFGEIRRLNTAILKYIIDEEVYAEYEIEKGSPITPEPNPTKEGYTFSGWCEIPDTMPDNDVIITGSFTINKYKLTYIIDGDVYKTYEIEYNAPIIPESAPIKKGMTLLGWEKVPDSMPAHDVTLSGTYIWFQNKVDNIIYQVTDTLNNYASVIGCDEACEEARILSSVKMGECEYKVDSISKEAFWYCTLLTSINIPEGLTSIGERAFYGCYRMKNIIIPNSVTAIGLEAFAGCESLISISLSNSLQRIEKGTFWKCESLASIIIPGSVISIGNSVFSGCSSLQSVTIGNGVTSIGSEVFEFCHNLTSITFPCSIMNIGSRAFEFCDNLKSIHIPDVGAWCNISFDDPMSNPFYYGGKLYLDDREVNDLIIPDSVTVVKRLAFCGCASLTSINIPNSVDSIGYKAFAFCSNIIDVYCYGLQVPNVDDDAFKGSYIQTLYVPKASLESYKSTAPWSSFGSIVPLEGEIEDDAYIDGIYYDFSDNDAKVVKGENAYSGDVVIPASVIHKGKTYNVTSIDDFAFFQCNELTSVTIPESITTIGQLAFATCSGLTSIYIPECVTSIGIGAFAECTGLTSISISENMTAISESLFSGCSNLISIIIPKGVTSIDERAFAYCSKLKSVCCYVEQVPNTADNAFENTPIESAVLLLPTSSAKEQYKTTAPWSEFGSIIAQTDEEVAGDGLQLENSSFDDWHVVGSGTQALYNPWKEGSVSFWDTGNRGATTVGASNSTYGTEDGRTYANLQSKFIVIKFAAGNIFTGSYLKTDGTNGILSLGRPFNSYPTKLQFDYTYKSSIVNKGGGKWDEKYSRYISQQTYDEMRGKPDSCCIWIALIGDKDEEEYEGVTYPFIIRTRPSELKLFDPNSDNVIAYGQFTSGDDQTDWTTKTITLDYRHLGEEPKYIIVVATSSKYGDYFIGGDQSLLKLDNLKLLYDDPIPIERQTFFAEQANGVQMEFGYISKINRTCQVGSGTRTSISTETSGGIDIPSVVEGYSVVAVGEKAFYNCSGLTSITIPNSVTTIERDAFSGCRLRNVLLRGQIPPAIDEDAFSKNIYNHTILYIPNESWDEYVFNSNWYQFINIRETITTEEQLSVHHAYTLMDANTFAYSVYDPVNDCIDAISSDGINEDNPNHCWQVIEADGERYLYNIGAKRFAVKAKDENGLVLSELPEAISMEDGENGIILGSLPTQEWALVSNERMSIDKSAEEEVTAIRQIKSVEGQGVGAYNLNGQRISSPQKGINIIRMNDGTVKKVLVK